jgi:D-mannonate dehydratase
VHFTRTLTEVSAPGGVRIHLHYDDPLERLSDVKRIVDNLAVETLVQYR